MKKINWVDDKGMVKDAVLLRWPRCQAYLEYDDIDADIEDDELNAWFGSDDSESVSYLLISKKVFEIITFLENETIYNKKGK